MSNKNYKNYKYTLFLLIFSVLFILGCMEIMNFILKLRETQLLTEGGRAKIDSPVWEWHEPQNSGETPTDDTYQDRHVLTVRQMEEAVSIWNSRVGEIIHEPVEGQISMSEAIENGREWLAVMGLAEEEPEEEPPYYVNATLSVGKTREMIDTKLEPYYSFWTIRFSNRTIEAELLINAVSGKVWGANIILYGTMSEKPYRENTAIFWEMAGLQVPETGLTKLSEGEMWTAYGSEDTSLYVRIGYFNLYMSEDSIVPYSDDETFHRERSVITYNLKID